MIFSLYSLAKQWQWMIKFVK